MDTDKKTAYRDPGTGDGDSHGRLLLLPLLLRLRRGLLPCLVQPFLAHRGARVRVHICRQLGEVPGDADLQFARIGIELAQKHQNQRAIATRRRGGLTRTPMREPVPPRTHAFRYKRRRPGHVASTPKVSSNG